MLSGIGGATLAEARERLSQAEFEAWRQYRRLRGSLNLGLRIEQGAALVAFCANQCRGDLDDYLPKREADDGSAALERAMKEWR